MNTIKIFLAGVRGLRESRLELKACADALTSKYGRSGPVTLQMSTYEDFDDDQIRIDSFIENEADMVVFVLDPSEAEESMSEIHLAYGSKRKRNRPEILTFVRATDGHIDFEQLKGVMQEVKVNHCIPFSHTNELCIKAQDRISAWMDKRLRKLQKAQGENVVERVSFRTPMFQAFLGVCGFYYTLAGLAWMLFYTMIGAELGISLRIYVVGILLLTVFWIVAANLVGRHGAGHASQSMLENCVEDMKEYVDGLRQMSEEYGKPETVRLWKQLIVEAESIPPRQFASKKTRLAARAQQLINN